MADRIDETERSVPDSDAAGAHVATTDPRTIDEARDALAETRRRIARDLDVIEVRLRGTTDELRGRLDLLEPARRRIRADVWTRLGLAFGAGVLLALLRGRDHRGRRRLPARVVRKTAAKLPGAVLHGARTGISARLGAEWHGRRALPQPPTATDGAQEAPPRAG